MHSKYGWESGKASAIVIGVIVINNYLARYYTINLFFIATLFYSKLYETCTSCLGLSYPLRCMIIAKFCKNKNLDGIKCVVQC
jgi:hypothetical protein